MLIKQLFPALVVAALGSLTPARGDVIGTFEDVNPGVNTFKNDFRPTNRFSTGGFTLNNNYSQEFNSWSGFSVSSKVDNTFGGLDYTHQYGAYAPLGANGTGSGGSATYAVASDFSPGDAVINVPVGVTLASIDLANTTYTAQSIVRGDTFARAFRQGDYFKLDILGFSGADGTGTQVGDVPFFLADFRGNSLQLLSDWATVNLSPLAGARSLEFALTSTDVGNFGMNTPATFAVDNLVGVTAVPEPSVLLLFGAGLGAVAPFSARRRHAIIPSVRGAWPRRS